VREEAVGVTGKCRGRLGEGALTYSGKDGATARHEWLGGWGIY